MLLYRSIFLQVCLVLAITRCNCQDYESSYGIDESDDHSDVQDDSGHPDYSKYYSVDTSAPLVSTQGNQEPAFLSPIEFSGFFSPIDFGASAQQEVAQPKNPFVQQDKKTLGFLTNQQFPDFYSSNHYPIDYFEEAQKSQRQEAGEEEADNPNYISYHLPYNIEGEFSSDVEQVEPKPLNLNKKKKQKKTKKDYDYEDADKEGTAEADRYKTPEYSYEYKPSEEFQPSSGKYVDYDLGKSSSTVSHHPQAPGYYENLSPTPTPYEKYSFQPTTEEGFKSKYLGSLISTVAPFNPAYSKVASTPSPVAIETQQSENIPSHLKDKNCRRIRKHISGGDDSRRRRKREAMNCFICEDPSNNSKYTQCSYAVEPEPINDYSGKSERYSIPAKSPNGFRYKRYSGDEYSSDPYEYIKKRSQASYSQPDETKEYEEYKIPDFYTDEGSDKSYSEIQSEAIAKNPANCHKEESNGMTCTICKDPKTGGNFEQCSYTSEPKEQKYAYVTEKKYDSNDEPEQGSESKPVEQKKGVPNDKQDQVEKKEQTSSEHKPSSSFDNDEFSKLKNFKPAEKFHSSFKTPDYKPLGLPSNENNKYSKLEDFSPADDYKANYQGHDKFKLSDEYNPDSRKEEYTSGQKDAVKSPKKLIDDDPYDIPKHFAESTVQEQKAGVQGLEPHLYGSSDSSEVEGAGDGDSSHQSDPYKDIDEYHFKLFPEFSNEESQQAEVVANPGVETTRKDVEEVLAEFSKKDRSACKKAEKNGMTCYLCVDDKGIQHEECMYISESKPQASHVAYHEVKQLKSPNKDNNQQSEQNPAGTEIKEKRLFKTVSTTPKPFSLEGAASEEIETKIKYKPNRRSNPKKTKRKEPVSSSSNYEEELNDDEKIRDHREQLGEHEKLNDDEKLNDADEPKPQAPAEFVVGDEEGAYSAETKPVYSKTLGVKLPKYMIEKSEFEKEFDEFAGVNY